MTLNGISKDMILRVLKHALADFSNVGCDRCHKSHPDFDGDDEDWDAFLQFDKERERATSTVNNPECVQPYAIPFWPSGPGVKNSPYNHITSNDKSGWCVGVTYTAGLRCEHCGREFPTWAAGYFVDDATGEIELWVA